MDPVASYIPPGERHNHPQAASAGQRVKRETVRVRGADLAVFRLTAIRRRRARCWSGRMAGATRTRNLLPLAQASRAVRASVLLDLPGFGASPLPPDAWGTADYADAVAEWLAGAPAQRRVWVGAFVRRSRRAAAGGAASRTGRRFVPDRRCRPAEAAFPAGAARSRRGAGRSAWPGS